ncbi:DUF4465 domain-containing protein [Rariglobus hedericola]|uniref:DUF4465 domain-containing protein n=1 Tax=Rariglobus hedericola TaxID=2597822 RepID=A0A556QLN6_9BACT|nr:DUF4465 domain-containing protein [Rariglobus hedericola]TSJ77544.1 DUF4465 domain-containing protein [Rariglobus hedericola]
MNVIRLLFSSVFLAAATSLSALTIDFFDVNTSTESGPAQSYEGPGNGVYYYGSDSAGGFTSGGAQFVNYYNSDWGSWSGWAYSTTADSVTAGMANQYSAFPGALTTGTPYGIAYVSSYDGPTTITLPAGIDTPLSLTLTNTTYAYDSMLNGDSFAKKFGGVSGNDADWFLLTITGKDAFNATLGSVEFYLADFRFADNELDYIITDWTDVDLTGLGTGVHTLEFTLTSSDSGDYGMNTPSYFALGGVTAVPEPSAYAALVGAFTLVLALTRRRRS